MKPFLFAITIVAASLLVYWKQLVPASEYQDEFGIEYVWIPVGEYLPVGKTQGGKRVGGFYMSKNQITVKEWNQHMEEDWQRNINGQFPIIWTSAVGANRFVMALNQVSQQGHYRLPTNEEWEYACRAGSKTKYFHGIGENGENLEEYAWNWDLAEKQGLEQEIMVGAVFVGLKKPNPWGLYDILGNPVEIVYAVKPDGSLDKGQEGFGFSMGWDDCTELWPLYAYYIQARSAVRLVYEP